MYFCTHCGSRLKARGYAKSKLHDGRMRYSRRYAPTLRDWAVYGGVSLWTNFEGSESRCRSHRAGGAVHCIAGAVQRSGMVCQRWIFLGTAEKGNFPLCGDGDKLKMSFSNEIVGVEY